MIANDDLPLDILAQGYCAPEWIRSWSGPFEILYDEDQMERIVSGPNLIR